MPTLPLHAQLAQAMKQPFLNWNEPGDAPPYLMVEQDGAIRYIVLTHADDIYEMLSVVRTCYASLPHDALIVVHEARFKEYRAAPDHPMTREQAVAEEHQRASYEQLAREGKAAAMGILDAVCVQRVPAEGKQTMWTLPYVYSGEGTPFLWLTSQFREMGGDTEYELGGAVHDALAHACSGPTMTEAIAQFASGPRSKRLRNQIAQLDAHRRDQVQVAMSLHFLESIGCLILSSPEAYGSLTPSLQ